MCVTSKICRLCLSNHRRTFSVTNTVLQNVWERLTNFKFDKDDGRPLVICYICCAHLRKSHELMERALKAEKLFTKYITNNHFEGSKKLVSLIVSKAYDIDYTYAIEEQYNVEFKQRVTNTSEEVKEDFINIKEEEEDEWTVFRDETITLGQEMDTEDDENHVKEEEDDQYNFGLIHGETNILEVEEVHHINIKEEVKDEFSDETVTVIDIEKDKNTNEEKAGASKKTRNLNEVPKGSKKLVSLIVSKAYDIDYTYAIEEQYNVEFKQRVTNTSEEVKEDFINIKEEEEDEWTVFRDETITLGQEMDTEDDENHVKEEEDDQYNFGLIHGETNILEVEEVHHINIKEEVKDEFSDETVTVIDIEKDKNTNEEKAGASKKTRNLNEVPKGSKKLVSLIVSKAYDIDYTYAIEEQYNVEFKQRVTNTSEEVKEDFINIKEEEEDEWTVFRDETITLGQEMDTEDDENHVKEEEDGASKKTRNLNEVPKVIKLNQIVNNNENLPKTTYKIPLNNFTSSDVQWSKNVLADRNVKIQVKDNTPKDDNLNEDIKYKDVILQNKNAPTQVISYVHAENENSEQIFPKRVSAIAPCTSLDSNDERKQSNIRNKTRSESSLLCQDKRTKKGIKDKHLRKRTADNSFICDLCDQKFSQKQGLKMHILYKHTEKNFSCHICRHKFVTKNKLDRHLQRYTGGKPYVCELCDYRATEKYEVSRHVQHRHGKEKSFPFQQRGNLNQDLSSQIVKKLFKCYLCDHRSSGKDLLSSHLLHKHSKDNNLPNKTYQYSLDINPLNRHLHKPNDKKGEEKKRYRCVLCYFRGSDISSVIVHMKEKHPK